MRISPQILRYFYVLPYPHKSDNNNLYNFHKNVLKLHDTMESQARPSVHLPKNSQAPSDRHRKLAEKPDSPVVKSHDHPKQFHFLKEKGVQKSPDSLK